MPTNLNSADRRVLAAVQREGRLTNVALAKRLGMSESASLRHLRRLELAGVIKGYAAIADRRALGFTVLAFVQVTLEKQPDVSALDFHERVRNEPHIVECHAMSGNHDYLLKVVARDIDHFSDLVMDGILKYPDVEHVETNFSLREIKSGWTLPV